MVTQMPAEALFEPGDLLILYIIFSLFSPSLGSFSRPSQPHTGHTKWPHGLANLGKGANQLAKNEKNLNYVTILIISVKMSKSD